MKRVFKYRLLIWIGLLYLCQPIQAFSQQISIQRMRMEYQWSRPSRTFNDRFGCLNPYFITVDSSEKFKAMKVKKVEILSPDSTLQWMLEFDSSGHLLKFGYGGQYCKYFTVLQRGKLKTGESFRVTEYYENNILARVDSNFQGIVRLRKGDTVFIYNYQLNRCYKSGKLLNEQGQYYNQLERPSPRGLKYLPWHQRIKYRVRTALKTAFKRKYVTSYSNDMMFFSVESMYTYYSGFTVGTDSMPAQQYKGAKENWLKNYNYTNNYIRCENYREKVVNERVMGCYTGKSEFDEEQRHVNEGVQYSMNKEGLNTGYYKDGYPIFVYRYTFFE